MATARLLQSSTLFDILHRTQVANQESSMTRRPRTRARSDTDRLIADRRNLHRQPELAYKENQTAHAIAERLRANRYEVKTGVGRTGVVGLLRGTEQAPEAGSKVEAQEAKGEFACERTLLYRADMDALPIQEE